MSLGLGIISLGLGEHYANTCFTILCYPITMSQHLKAKLQSDAYGIP